MCKRCTRKCTRDVQERCTRDVQENVQEVYKKCTRDVQEIQEIYKRCTTDDIVQEIHKICTGNTQEMYRKYARGVQRLFTFLSLRPDSRTSTYKKHFSVRVVCDGHNTEQQVLRASLW